MSLRLEVPTNLNIDSGEITITKGDLEYSQLVDLQDGSASVVFEEIQPGIWQIYVALYDEDGFLLYEGSDEAEIHGGEATSAHIVLTELSGDLEVLIEMPGAGWSFYESFDGDFDHEWVATPALPDVGFHGPAAFTGLADYSFETDDGAQVLRMTNLMEPFSRCGLIASQSCAGTEGVVEARVNTRTQNSEIIDGLFELWLVNSTDPDKYVMVALFGGSYSADRDVWCCSSESGIHREDFDYENDTWYLFRITATEASLHVSVWDDAGTTELFAHDFGHTLDALGSSFRVAIAQYMDSPGGAYTADSSVDYVEARNVPVTPGGPASWLQFGYDPQHTSFNPAEHQLSPANVGDLEVAWTRSTPCTIRLQVSVVDGIAYYGHYCGEILAVDAATGAMIWSQDFPGKHQGQAVADGIVYVSSCNNSGSNWGTLFAFDAATGATIWSWHDEERRFGLPVVADDLIYINSSGDDPYQALHVVDATSGSELWSLSGMTQPTIAGDLLFTTYWPTQELQARDLLTGELLWAGETDGSRLSSQCVANGLVYVHSIDGHLYAFEASRNPPNVDGICAPVWFATTQLQASFGEPQAPAVAYGNVFVGSSSTFYAFDAAGCGSSPCSPVWSATTSCGYFAYQPAIANDVVYTTCGNNYLYAFDATSGAELWSYYTSGGGTLRSSPAIVDGRVYHAATFDFTLYVFE